MIIFCSCDPGHAVILQNNSDSHQSIRVVRDKRPNLHSKSIGFLRDSLTTIFDDNAREVLFTLDSSTGDFVFELDPNQSMMFNYGITGLDLEKKLILNNVDTLDFKSKDNLQVGGTFMSKQYVFTVNPKEDD